MPPKCSVCGRVEGEGRENCDHCRMRWEANYRKTRKIEDSIVGGIGVIGGLFAFYYCVTWIADSPDKPTILTIIIILVVTGLVISRDIE